MDGATPKETTSAKESRSLPKLELTFSALATKPSNTSINAASAINKLPQCIWSLPNTGLNSSLLIVVRKVGVSSIKAIAIQPKKRLASVKILGKCFIIKINFFYRTRVYLGCKDKLL